MCDKPARGGDTHREVTHNYPEASQSYQIKSSSLVATKLFNPSFSFSQSDSESEPYHVEIALPPSLPDTLQTVMKDVAVMVSSCFPTHATSMWVIYLVREYTRFLGLW